MLALLMFSFLVFNVHMLWVLDELAKKLRQSERRLTAEKIKTFRTPDSVIKLEVNSPSRTGRTTATPLLPTPFSTPSLDSQNRSTSSTSSGDRSMNSHEIQASGLLFTSPSPIRSISFNDITLSESLTSTSSSDSKVFCTHLY